MMVFYIVLSQKKVPLVKTFKKSFESKPGRQSSGALLRSNRNHVTTDTTDTTNTTNITDTTDTTDTATTTATSQ
jgi:hypothetical protein